MERLFFAAGALLAGLAVAAGAFGSHGLQGRLSAERMEVYQVAVRYQMFHALGCLAAAWAVRRYPGSASRAAGWLFLAGILVFSGSLYALVLSELRWLGAITPLGGLAFLAGWLSLALAALRARSSASGA